MIILRLTESFFGREDRALTDALLAEREGILHWAIDGWARLRSRGYFMQPSSSDQLREQLDELSSPMAAFLTDRCELGPAYTVECADLYKSWCEWCVKRLADHRGRQISSVAILRLRSAQESE